jgi:hypothetical protein
MKVAAPTGATLTAEATSVGFQPCGPSRSMASILWASVCPRQPSQCIAWTRHRPRNDLHLGWRSRCLRGSARLLAVTKNTIPWDYTLGHVHGDGGDETRVKENGAAVYPQVPADRPET